jgi:hypothetical protein
METIPLTDEYGNVIGVVESPIDDTGAIKAPITISEPYDAILSHLKPISAGLHADGSVSLAYTATVTQKSAIEPEIDYDTNHEAQRHV